MNIEDVLDRLKARQGLRSAKDLAAVLGLSPADLSNRKGRGTLLTPIIEWAIAAGVDLNELVYGPEASPTPLPSAPPPLPPDEERLLLAYRAAGRHQEDVLELAELKAQQARLEARMAAKERAPPDRMGAGVVARRRAGGG